MAPVEPSSGPVEVVMCDADGNLFASEEPAFDASVGVVNDLLGWLGSPRRFAAAELRRATTGQNFRATAQQLAKSLGRQLSESELEEWVSEERRVVTAHLARVLVPEPELSTLLLCLSTHVELAVVTSSARSRLDTCLSVTGLGALFGADRRFSAEDSLPLPRSKPHPDIYVHALATLGVDVQATLAIEDSGVGVRSAVGAGVPTVGNLAFVSAGERAERERELRESGALAVFSSWQEIARFIAAPVLA